jgi:hypothetical protein
LAEYDSLKQDWAKREQYAQDTPDATGSGTDNYNFTKLHDKYCNPEAESQPDAENLRCFSDDTMYKGFNYFFNTSLYDKDVVTHTHTRRALGDGMFTSDDGSTNN